MFQQKICSYCVYSTTKIVYNRWISVKTTYYDGEQTEMRTTIKDKLLLPITWDDATWILSCSFMIFTMQTGKTASLSNK